MISISSRSRFVAAASPLALALMLRATPGLGAGRRRPPDHAARHAAATADADAPTSTPTPQADQGSSIVVTGFRASLQSATSTRRRRPTRSSNRLAPKTSASCRTLDRRIHRPPAGPRRAAHSMAAPTSSPIRGFGPGLLDDARSTAASRRRPATTAPSSSTNIPRKSSTRSTSTRRRSRR